MRKGEQFRCWPTTAFVAAILAGVCSAQDAPPVLDYRVELSAASSGYDGKSCWVHARAGIVPPRVAGNPSDTPVVIMTLQRLLLSRSDVFYGLNVFETSDLGRSWKGPTEPPELARRSPNPGQEVVPCDFWPMWHKPTGKLLGTGATFWYDTARNDHMANAPSETAYAAYDPVARTWSPWKSMQMPSGKKYEFARAGCTQRYDLPNGDILLPIYCFQSREMKHESTTVCRCRFDGETLTFIEHGNELTVKDERGLCEGGLARFGNRFYLTMRNDVRGYVATSDDGLHFDEPRPWKFDDGADLGNYNTQQHWVTHSDGLFLVYTRRGAKNDHTFRNRAPLFMARVDPEKLVVIRETERELMPNRGAGLGNFGVTDVTPDETWVISTEWMQPVETAPKYGSDNSVWVARLVWNRPNQLLIDAER